jgi:hypothetical protein
MTLPTKLSKLLDYGWEISDCNKQRGLYILTIDDEAMMYRIKDDTILITGSKSKLEGVFEND